MCRVYRAKQGWYVRLCYVHGARKGEHVPVPEGYRLPGRHYPRSGRGVEPRGRRAPVPRCHRCGAPLSRHRHGLCRFCEEEGDRGLRDVSPSRPRQLHLFDEGLAPEAEAAGLIQDDRTPVV